MFERYTIDPKGLLVHKGGMSSPRSTRSAAVVVLGAGKGERLKSSLPKVMHRVAGVPLIRHVINEAAKIAPARTVAVIGPGMDALAAEVGSAAVAIQKKPLGTADAVKAARAALDGFVGDVLVIYGDNPFVSEETMRALLARRTAQDDPAVVVVGFEPEDRLRYGRLIPGKGDKLLRIVEFKDASERERERFTVCNSGVMALDGRHLFALVDAIQSRNAAGEYYLTDVVEVAREKGLETVFIKRPAHEFIGIDTRAQLALAEAHMQARLRARAMESGATLVDPATVYLSADTKIGRDVVIGPNVVFGPGVTVADGVEILPFCHIEGAAIEAGARVGPFARLRPGARIGRDAHIGNYVEVKNARVEDGAKVNHLAYIGDARVGAGANVGAGTITCNYDGYGKYFTDIGKGAFIGSNAALVAPVKVGDGAIVGAGSVVTEDVPADALRVERAGQTTVPGWAAKFRRVKAAEKTAKAKAAAKTKGR
jgi:bifunctional UDP-N-acetylglucosamine pyrophosphorylase/glucosamine-1-phosphate N-acetyltransferase